MSATANPVLFLDFDGVLHAEDVRMLRGVPTIFVDDRPTRNATALFEHAEMLADLLEPFPDVRIVLSTTWVRLKSFSRARRRLPHALQRRVIGATWHSAMQVATGSYDSLDWVQSQTRYQTIVADAARRQASRWLALDDDLVGWPEDQRHRIVAPTDTVLALAQPGIAEQLTAALNTLTQPELTP